MSSENPTATSSTARGDGQEVSHDQEDGTYQAPAPKSIDDLVNADAEDDSLKRYKEALLGSAVKGSGSVIVEPEDPRKVIIKRMALVVAGRDDELLDLTENLKEIKKKVFVIKEGIQFQIRIDFIVQREIVTGLKYVQKTTRMGVPVDKMTHMVGSYAPKESMHSYTTPMEDAPSGMAGRGTYHVSSLFCDDDKNEHLKWEWTTEIKKDWK